MSMPISVSQACVRTASAAWPLRVPHEPIPLNYVVRQTLGDDAPACDVGSLRSRTLLAQLGSR